MKKKKKEWVKPEIRFVPFDPNFDFNPCENINLPCVEFVKSQIKDQKNCGVHEKKGKCQ